MKTGKIWKVWCHSEEVVLKILVASVLVAVVLGVIIRYLPIPPNISPLPEELGRLSLIWLVMLAGSAGVRENKHFRVEVIVDRLGPEIGRFWRMGLELLILAFVIILLIQSVKMSLFVAKMGFQTMNMEWPAVIYTVSLVPASALMSIYLIIHIASRITRRS